jgi:hypothetical protein
VGAEGDVEGPHARSEFGPKLTLTGLLEARVLGHPVEISAKERSLSVRTSSLGTVWKLWKSLRGKDQPLIGLLRSSGLRVCMQIGRVGVELLPRPSLLVRSLVPALRGGDSMAESDRAVKAVERASRL